MKKYLVDTGPLVALTKGRGGVEALLRPLMVNDEVATSIVVYGEIIRYFRSLPNYSEHRTKLRQLLQGVSPYQLTYSIMERYADLRRTLRPLGAMIGDIDTLIAATALEHNLTIVTLDGDFRRVPGLSVMLFAHKDLQ